MDVLNCGTGIGSIWCYTRGNQRLNSLRSWRLYSRQYHPCFSFLRREKFDFVKEWIAHIEAKHHHFTAAAQYRKSVDDLEANRFGHEVARLMTAHGRAKLGYDTARKNLVSKPVLDDLKVRKCETCTERCDTSRFLVSSGCCSEEFESRGKR